MSTSTPSIELLSLSLAPPVSTTRRKLPGFLAFQKSDDDLNNLRSELLAVRLLLLRFPLLSLNIRRSCSCWLPKRWLRGLFSISRNSRALSESGFLAASPHTSRSHLTEELRNARGGEPVLSVRSLRLITGSLTFLVLRGYSRSFILYVWRLDLSVSMLIIF